MGTGGQVENRSQASPLAPVPALVRRADRAAGFWHVPARLESISCFLAVTTPTDPLHCLFAHPQSTYRTTTQHYTQIYIVGEDRVGYFAPRIIMITVRRNSSFPRVFLSGAPKKSTRRRKLNQKRKIGVKNDAKTTNGVAEKIRTKNTPHLI